jgi:hypothetical protein
VDLVKEEGVKAEAPARRERAVMNFIFCCCV